MTTYQLQGAAGGLRAAALLFAALAGCDGDKGDDTGDPSERPTLTDNDGDGYGAEADCDDASAAVSPGAPEVCNGIDDDCDGLSDEAGAVDGTMYYPDADGDGFGDALGGALACSQPDGTVTDGTDCDDATAARSPLAEEVCDELDNDCDDEVDEPGASGGLSAHPDADGDGYGDASISLNVCAFGDGYVANDDDCDDDDADARPDAVEVCDEIDNDCDGGVDNDARDADTYYEDGDGDGYGLDDVTTEACDTPEGYARKDGDCDDRDARVNPGEDEYCDGEDDDCDGAIDDDPVDISTWYYDTDGDGYGADETALVQCDSPGTGYYTDGGDCDEDDTSVNPGADDTWYDGWDTNCDGASDYDQDADGYVTTDIADADAPTYDPGTGEVVEDGSTTEAGDCDDENNRVNPGREERCNDVDDDCSGVVDDDAVDGRTYYTDEDSDGYGDEETAITTCDALTGDYIRTGGDCDDSDAEINPDATESCDDTDGKDNDCDGSADEVCYYGTLNYQYGYGSDPTERDCDLYWTGTWEISEEACPDCEYGFTVDFAYEEDISDNTGRCVSPRSPDLAWRLAIDDDYDGSGEPAVWYAYSWDYYEGYEDDVDYGVAGAPPAAYYWYPRFDATWDPSTGALTFWSGRYEYPVEYYYDYEDYDYGVVADTPPDAAYYWTSWWYGTADLDGIGG